jgi:hypothetical protein
MKEAWDGKINERNDNLPELEQRNQADGHIQTPLPLS